MNKVSGLLIIALLTYSCSGTQNPDNGMEIIGKWVEQSTSHGSSIKMYREDDHIYLESRYGQHVNGTKEMVLLIVAGQHLYVEKEGDQAIYYMISSYGDLKVFSAHGVIMSYRKMKL